MKAADIKSGLKEGCLPSSLHPDQHTAKTTWDHLDTLRQAESGKQRQIINAHFFFFYFVQYDDTSCLTKNLFKVDFRVYSS